MALSFESIAAARARIADHVHRTPVLTSSSLSAQLGAELWFKCENLQKVGAFKMRGATNAIRARLERETVRSIVAHSSGNHGAAVALAARLHGLSAAVVMPQHGLESKRQRVAAYGAEVVLCDAAALPLDRRARALAEERGAALYHTYDDHDVFAGQGTAAAELHEQAPPHHAQVAPLGGGGLLSGCCVAVAGLSPRTRVIGAEPERADDAQRSLREGHICPALPPGTIADGLLTSLGEKTFAVLRGHGVEVLTASEAQIVEAMRLIWTRMKLVVEPSAATALAIVLAHPSAFRGRRVGVLLSGGNVDLDRLPW
jgi:threonine dehydratase